MASVTVTPVVHHIYNEFDKFGLLLGLDRLDAERNWEYKWRLLDIFVNRASSTYYGLINGITRELGLEIIKAVKITMPSEFSLPAVSFEGTRCILYEDYVNGVVHAELERLSTAGETWTMQQLVDAINATSFTAELLDDADPAARSMGIFRQSSVVQISGESIEGKGTKIQLEHYPVVEGTVSISSSNMAERVYSPDNLKYGQYYIDLDVGMITSTVNPSLGTRIRYKYIQDKFVAKFSPVIIHDIHSDDFKSVMFQQIASGVWGRPTPIGADVVNELLSVYPYSWGK